jgi:hypothetical protein
MELLRNLDIKVSKQEFSLIESIPVGITKGKDQLVGYGKHEDDSVQVRVLTNKWEVLKPF